MLTWFLNLLCFKKKILVKVFLKIMSLLLKS